MTRRIILILTTLLFVSCNPKDEKYTLKDFTQNCYEDVILPMHKKLSKESVEFTSKIKSLSIESSEKELIHIRKLWKNLHKNYTGSVIFNIDNIKDNYAHLYLQQFPCDTQKVVKNINSDPSNTIVSSNAQGLSTFEYLLFRKGALDSIQKNQKNIIFIHALAKSFNTKVIELEELWKSNAVKYKNNSGKASKNAFNQLVNGIIQFSENLKMLKLGIPIGKQSFSRHNIHLSQAPFSNASLSGLEKDIETLQLLWSGNSTPSYSLKNGLSELIKDKNPKLCKRIDSSFKNIRSSLANTPRDFNTAIEDKHPQLENLHTHLNDLYTLLKVDLSAQLDVQVFISDLDGD